MTQEQTQEHPPQVPKYISLYVPRLEGEPGYYAVIKQDHRYFETEKEADDFANNLNRKEGLK